MSPDGAIHQSAAAAIFDEVEPYRMKTFVVKRTIDRRVLFLNAEFGWGPYSAQAAHFLTHSFARRIASQFTGAYVASVVVK